MPAGRLSRSTARLAGFAICVALARDVAVAQGSFTPSARPRLAEPGTCPSREGRIFADGAGVVIGFLDRAEALSMRLRVEMGLRALSDPTLRDNPRAIVEVTRPQGRSREIAVVPGGMTVEIGEAVVFDGGYWSPDDPCVFRPNLIRKPAPTG